MRALHEGLNRFLDPDKFYKDKFEKLPGASVWYNALQVLSRELNPDSREESSLDHRAFELKGRLSPYLLAVAFDIETHNPESYIDQPLRYRRLKLFGVVADLTSVIGVGFSLNSLEKKEWGIILKTPNTKNELNGLTPVEQLRLASSKAQERLEIFESPYRTYPGYFP